VEEKPPQQKPKGTAFFGTRGLVKTFSSADRRLADRQLILGEIWAWLTKGGERNALDDFCNLVGVVVARRGQ
jgi:hypothetical protein